MEDVTDEGIELLPLTLHPGVSNADYSDHNSLMLIVDDDCVQMPTAEVTV